MRPSLATGHSTPDKPLARQSKMITASICPARRLRGRSRLQKQEARHGSAGRAWKEGGSMLLVDAVGALTAFRLEGFHLVPSLLHRAGHEAPHRVLLPAHLVRDLVERGAVLPLEHRDNLGRLAAFTNGASGFFLAFGRVFPGSGLLRQLTFGGGALGRPCATFGLTFRFRLDGLFRLRLFGCAEGLDALPNRVFRRACGSKDAPCSRKLAESLYNFCRGRYVSQISQ